MNGYKNAKNFNRHELFTLPNTFRQVFTQRQPCLFAYTVQAELFINSFFPTRNELKGFDSFSQNNL